MTWFNPYLIVTGFSPSFFSSPLFNFWVASDFNLSLFSFLVSGVYEERTLNTWEANLFINFYYFIFLLVDLSKGLKNWEIEGGTFNLLKRILFFLWIWTYLGHLTNLDFTILGLIWAPNLKFLFCGWVKGCFSFNFLICDWVKIVPFFAFFTYLKVKNYPYHWNI